MKLAISTNNKKTISKDYFIQCNYYMVFEILNGEIVSEELRENPYSDKNTLTNHERTNKILDLLKDCTIFLGKQMEKESLDSIASKNIDIIITTKNNVKETIKFFLESIDEYFQYYNLKSKKFITCSERMMQQYQ
ncbi:MAG: NifB/NifX family molybdenum-iron cluster-binding protein [bacterium]